MLWLCISRKKKKKRNGKRNTIERKKANSLSRIPSPTTGINTDLSSWPSLWLSSWPRVTKANRRHWWRIGGMAQLLWGWLEFPVSFLTDTVRKVQSCNNSVWKRTHREQFPWAVVLTGWEEWAFPKKQSLTYDIQVQMLKGSFAPSVLNVFPKGSRLWYLSRYYVPKNYHHPDFTLTKNTLQCLSLSPLLGPDVMWCVVHRVEPLYWKQITELL